MTNFQLSIANWLKNLPSQTIKKTGDKQIMIIILNGENKQVDSNASIEQLLHDIGLSDKRLAVEVNQQIVPRSDFDKTTLQEADKVEIVQAIGGGST